MRKRNRDLFMTAIGAVVGAAAAVWGVRELLARFKTETETVKYNLSHHSRMVETACGPMEVSIHGEGPPVLVVHGAAGGYDQGEVRSEAFSGIQYISISRPGYLRTPLSTGATPAEQADALAALLDALGIRQAALIGTSTGGLVGIFFALRHPERCSALVLVSAVNAPLPSGLTNYTRLAPLLSTDFLPWTLLHPETLLLIRPTLRKQIAAHPEKLSVIEELVHTAYPTSLRLSGLQNDAHQIQALESLPLESIQTPTLVIHGTADQVVPFKQGVESAARIPGAVLLPVLEGTHYCILTHLELTRPAIMDFLAAHRAV